MRTDHVRGEWVVIRRGNLTIAQGYACSCGTVGCSRALSLRGRDIVARYDPSKPVACPEYDGAPCLLPSCNLRQACRFSKGAPDA